MPQPQLRAVTLSLFIFLPLVSGLPVEATSQEPLGGASLVFIKRPKNPPVAPRALRAKAQPTGSTTSAPAPQTEKNNSAAKDEMADAIEDALALGNSARDAEPPRYPDAEKAYKLAAKLDDKDPRPYLGLANLWYDQKNYQAAAQMYREATERMTPKKAPFLGAFMSKSEVKGTIWATTNRGEVRAYFANALLQLGLVAQAQTELQSTISEDPKNAESYALLGYCFVRQKKYAEAVAVLKKALELSPNTPEYKQLLDEAVAHQSTQ